VAYLVAPAGIIDPTSDEEPIRSAQMYVIGEYIDDIPSFIADMGWDPMQ
jgi:hypothetical protein